MTREPAFSALAIRWMVGGEWRAHPGRVVVAALAIAIGIWRLTRKPPKSRV